MYIDTQSIAIECKLKRISKKLSQSDIAKMCGVSRETVSRFERGNDVSLSFYLKYKEVLENGEIGKYEATIEADPEATGSNEP